MTCGSRLSLTGSRGTGDGEGGGGAGGVNGLNMHMEPSQELKIKTVPKSGVKTRQVKACSDSDVCFMFSNAGTKMSNRSQCGDICKV